MAKKKDKEQEVDTQEGVEDVVLGELIDEEECRQRIAAIIRRLPGERKRLAHAVTELRNVEHKAWIAASFLRDDLFTQDDAKKAALDFKQAIADGKSKTPIEADKKAIAGLEIAAVKLEHELAKMAVEASETDYDMLNGQLIWYQSIRKNNGPVVPIEQSIDKTYLGYEMKEIAPGVEVNVPVPLTPEQKVMTEFVDNEADFVPPNPFAVASSPAADVVDLQANEAQAKTLADMITPTQLNEIRAIGETRSINVDGVAHGLFKTELGQLTKDAGQQLIDYLNDPLRMERPLPEKAATASVASVYGGPEKLSDYRAAHGIEVVPTEQPETQYREIDGRITKVGDDGDCPF